MKPILMDLHSHSKHSMDGSHSVSEMCAQAAKLNIGVFAITDHCEINDFAKFNTQQTLSASVAALQKAQDQYCNQMKVLVGIELGQPLQDMKLTQAVLAAHPFDFILGSLHNAQDRPDFYFFDYNSEALDLNKELEAYFAELLAMIRWGGFDSAAHISYPFRYIRERYQRPFKIKDWDDYFDTVVKLLAEKGLALELNTSGLNKTPAYTMPDAAWIKRFREHGGEKITLGSDAHKPEAIGTGLDQAVYIAKQSGFNYLCYFEQRRPQFLAIKNAD